MAKTSRRSKAQDQRYLSQEEIDTGTMQISEKKVARALMENSIADLYQQLGIVFGPRWVKRLENSALREKKHLLVKLQELTK